MNDLERQEQAKKVMPDYLKIIEIDLMKVTHYLNDGVKIAIVMKDTELSEKLARFYIEADELTKNFMTLTRRIVD